MGGKDPKTGPGTNVSTQVVTREEVIRDLLRDQNFLQHVKAQIDNEIKKTPPRNPVVQNVVDLFNYQSEIPTFSGDSVGPTFEEWWNKFDAIARCAKWDPQRRLQVFPSKLTSTAFDFYRQLERTEPQVILDMDILKARFEDRFKDPTTRETYLTRFHAAYKLPAETIKDFAQRLEKLFSKAFPGQNMTDVQVDYQLKIRFIAGLDPRLQRYVRSANPATLKDAVTVAIREQENEDLLNKQMEKEMVVSAISSNNKTEDQIATVVNHFTASLDQQKKMFETTLKDSMAEAITSAIGKLETASKGQSKGQSDKTCFNCGKKGHFAAACWSKKSNQRSNRQQNGQGKPAFCHHCKRQGHTIYNCFQMSKVLQENLSKLKCNKCGETGHIASKCDQSN
jgi:hypothetical protein